MPHFLRKNFANQFSKFNLNDFKSIEKNLVETQGITHTDLQRIKLGKLTAQFFAAYVSCESSGKDAIRFYK